MSERSKFKRRVREHLTEFVDVQNGINIRKLRTRTNDHNIAARVQKVSLGTLEPHRDTKIILLVGATGAGKSTLINAMINYIYCVDFEDDYRLILVDDRLKTKTQAESQTDLITAYQFPYMDGMPFNYNYILVDTPGFGDTRGIQRDQEMMNQLEMFFRQNYGVDHVNGVGFVVQSTSIRLTPTQKYIFDGLMGMFGKDIEENIFIMATFASTQKPQILEAIKLAGIKYKYCYQFDNNALYATKTSNSATAADDSDDEMEVVDVIKMYWKLGQKNIKKFFSHLKDVTPCSLHMTKDVLEKRIKLQKIVVGLQDVVQIGLRKMSSLQEEKNLLTQIDSNVEKYKDYELEYDVEKLDEVPDTSGYNTFDVILDGAATQILSRCSPGMAIATAIANPLLKLIGKAIGLGGGGTKYKTKWVKERKTVPQLLEKYNQCSDEKLSKEGVINQIQEEIKSYGTNVLKTIKEAHEFIKKLEETALRPNPMSVVEYIDILIQSEKNQMQTDYQKRIDMLEKLKTQFALLVRMREDPSHLGKEGEDILLAVQRWLNL